MGQNGVEQMKGVCSNHGKIRSACRFAELHALAAMLPCGRADADLVQPWNAMVAAHSGPTRLESSGSVLEFEANTPDFGSQNGSLLDTAARVHTSAADWRRMRNGAGASPGTLSVVILGGSVSAGCGSNATQPHACRSWELCESRATCFVLQIG